MTNLRLVIIMVIFFAISFTSAFALPYIFKGYVKKDNVPVVGETVTLKYQRACDNQPQTINTSTDNFGNYQFTVNCNGPSEVINQDPKITCRGSVRTIPWQQLHLNSPWIENFDFYSFEGGIPLNPPISPTE